MFITNVTENKFSKSPDEQGLVCGHWGTSHPLTPLSGHNWSERTVWSKYTNTNTNTNTQTQTHSLLATSDGLYLIRACSLARASTSRGGEVCIRFVFALVKRISVACFFLPNVFPFLRDWKTYLQNSTCLSKALSQNFRPQKSHAWGGQKITKRTKLTLNKNSPCNCLLPLPVAFSFLSLCCFLTPCSAPPEVLDEQFSELIFFYQTSTSDFHSLLTASKIFLGLLFAFSQIWNVKVKKWSRDEKRRRDDLVNCVRREGGDGGIQTDDQMWQPLDNEEEERWTTICICI